MLSDYFSSFSQHRLFKMNQYQLIVLFEVLAHASMLNYASPVQLCGRELAEALRSICGDRGYYSPGQSFSRRAPTHDGIATRCCQSLCESSILETYCNLPAPPSQTQPSTAAPTTTKMAPLTEDRRTKDVVVDYSDQLATEGSQMSRVDGALTQDTVTNRSKTTTESNEGSFDNEEGATYDKPDDSSPSERGESIQDEDNEVNKPEPNNIRDSSKERGRNRTHKGLSSERRANNSRRRGLSSERRGSSSSRREEKLRRRRQRHRERELREQRKQSNSKRKSKGDKKDHSVAATTPLAVQERPLKNGGRNGTSGEHSSVNGTETDTAGSPEVKKDDLITTITAVLSDMIGFQPDNGNR
ncbi:uncharacterized protein [Asterias amurensis]|uniref:uncharacterized protein isoform X1 n=2 Tax=Asterias amurensis TaxID=7602 RepID=UPI003AB78813